MSSLYLREDLLVTIVGQRLSVVGAEAKHAATVNRTRVGEVVAIGNGRGLVATGPVVLATPSEVTIDVEAVDRVARPAPLLTLAQALAKGDRDELAVQASTELGVDAVIPWAAERSVSRWEGPKVAKGRERWGAIVREAAKQSIRPWVPEVGELMSSKQLPALASANRMLVLEPTAETPLSSIRPDGRDLVVVVGPEGGLSDSELARFADAGAELVRLGGTVLRTSTAGPAAIAVLNALIGRW
ncbi:16S rRNA (uracil(1498)-N(3))-methyltransferase [Diaminobutyricibacter tongyongensis]|uniref:Ribosomal RNA small subunit methyltransferase E n=1 Tax=Leifsonia tongyongensis TaxID=1268043 RepID=A0A6L9XZQ5_9MICO|nr:16S rRNA (uracil(1498)-N(3))-methyltransferase [Diaminobutyricibacter tongyongensis]